MCGIFGYVGHQKEGATRLCLEGLKRLEYRGYDSAGIAGLSDEGLKLCKVKGKVAALQEAATEAGLQVGTAIAHTRWATHGAPCEANAHPHFDAAESLAVVHNGIIENHEALRQKLVDQGVTFASETDSEVIAQLVASLYQGDLRSAVQEAMVQLKGALAIALVHKDHPNHIIAAARQSPLAIGVGNGETFVASDTSAFLAHTSEVLYLSDGEVAQVTPEGFQLFDETASQVLRETETLTGTAEEVNKGGYEHFMLKEIYEQPQTLRNALLSRYVQDVGNAKFEELQLTTEDLLGVRRILVLACGTAWHAGFVTAYTIEDIARIPVQVEISSEFRYKNPIIEEGTLVIAISQSGETADTLAAVRELKEKGAWILAICNVQGSTLAREADSTLLLRAGPEIGVASTKAFTSMLAVSSLLSLLFARTRDMSQAEGHAFIEDLKRLPDQVAQILELRPQIQELAAKYGHYENFFFLGRRHMFPTALEGALKLKEISYINANGYPAGEMKHGPIALINPNCATVACCANGMTHEKLRSNLMEVKARGGPLLAISDCPESAADDTLIIPSTRDELAPILTTVATQLLSYEIALLRGCEIDQPRNLAKSVTVE